MASLRYYYSNTISDFLNQESEEIVGKLTLASPHKVDNETKGSWLDEISVMKSILPQYSGKGSVFFEYSIPRMGRRVDIILLIDGLVFVLEFKLKPTNIGNIGSMHGDNIEITPVKKEIRGNKSIYIPLM